MPTCFKAGEQAKQFYCWMCLTYFNNNGFIVVDVEIVLTFKCFFNMRKIVFVY